MSDKKKKKSKQKQNQNQRQTQQVIVNVDTRVRRRSVEPRREVRENKLNISAQPPPIVQYVYRDNLALNAINERMRENAITQTLMKTAQQLASQTQSAQQPQTYQPPKLATPSPALYQQPAPPATAPPPNVLRKLPDARDVIINNNIYNSAKVPEQPKTIARPEAFEKALNKQMDALEEREQRQQKQESSPILPEATGVRLNKNGQPDRRTREGRMLYNQMLQEKQQNEKEEQAPPMTSVTTVLPPPPPRVRQISSSKINPVDEKTSLIAEDDEEEASFFSPLKQKPT